MKTILLIAALTFFSHAYAGDMYGCDSMAENYIKQKYQETVTNVRVLNYGEAEPDIEVVVYTSRPGVYSVYLPAFDCPWVNRDIRWK